MKKIAITTTILLLAGQLMAQSSKIINIFYDGRTSEFAVNTEKSSGRTGFIRSNKFILVTRDISICQMGCIATLNGKNHSTFSVVVAGNEVATVKTNDPDNLLSNRAFSTAIKAGKELLVMNLDELKRDSRAEVK